MTIGTRIPYKKDIWDRIVGLAGRKRGASAKRPSLVRVILDSDERNADYHYHFLAQSYKSEGKSFIDIEVSLHVNKATSKKRSGSRLNVTPNIESWLIGLLGEKYEGRPLSVDLDCQFSFKKPSFASVLPMPFKSPFDIPTRNRALGELSISGLKFQLDPSVLGVRTIYFEAFEKSIGTRVILGREAMLDRAIVESVLKDASTIALMFVKSIKEQEADTSS